MKCCLFLKKKKTNEHGKYAMQNNILTFVISILAVSYANSVYYLIILSVYLTKNLV